MSSAWNYLCVLSLRCIVRIGWCICFYGVNLERTVIAVPKNDCMRRLKHIIEVNIEGRIKVTGR